MTKLPMPSPSPARSYHERSKHHFQRYAASLGYMDWANQPDPFRRYSDCEHLALDHPALRNEPSYDSLFDQTDLPTEPLDRPSISRLFYQSLALSAWKQASASNRWSLRVNPSSGALHPTEGYLICGPIAGLTDTAGVFHYSPYEHALERRLTLDETRWRELIAPFPAGTVLVGLTSIYWRESWKYGERAFRYCHHDVGHAIGALAVAARTIGWNATLVPHTQGNDLDHLLGVFNQQGPEAEHADCLLAVTPGAKAAPPIARPILEALVEYLKHGAWQGVPNRLSREHHAWPVIDQIAADLRAAEPMVNIEPPASGTVEIPAEGGAGHSDDRGLPAEQIIRQRRSAVDMDGQTWLERDEFYRILRRTLPAACGPMAVWSHVPRVSLALFVHRVRDLTPGLYVLVRTTQHEASLRTKVRDGLAWQRPPGCPDDLKLYLLQAADTREAAQAICCHQEIAADGVFAVGMLAEFDAALATHGDAYYSRLFWETGLIGQILYLEAETAGVRGTGIGCFFDDAMHQVLGITHHSWQSLYHFTIGGPVPDVRLQTLPPYGHLE